MRPWFSVSAFSILRDGNFRSLWTAFAVHETARRMETLVLSWLILEKTNSPFQLGLVLVFQNLAWPFTSMFGGLVADRFSRYRVLLSTQVLNLLIAVSMLGLIASDVVQPWHVFLVTFLQGLSRAVENPSRRTALFDIAGDGRLIGAMSLEQIGVTSGRLMGPILGGVLIEAAGITGSFIALVALRLVPIALLAPVKVPRAQWIAAGEGVRHSLGAAVRYAASSRVLLVILFVSFFLNFLVFPMEQFIPAIGRDHLQVGPALIGLLAAANGIGQLISASFIGSTKGLRRHGLLFLLGSLAMATAVVLFPWAPWYTLAFAILLVHGLGHAAFGVMQTTIPMMITPKEMRGRMAGLISFCIGSATSPGAAAMGALAGMAGTQWALSGNAGAAVFLLLLTLALSSLAWRPVVQQPPVTSSG